MYYPKVLKIFLYLISIHSVVVGLCLIVLPKEIFQLLGIIVSNRFFPTQGGVFHILMAVVYYNAAQRIGKDSIFINLTIFIKFTATVFLFVYYFMVESIIIVLLSGIGDLVMCAVVYVINCNIKSCTKIN